MENKLNIRLLAVGEYHGKRIALTKENGHYCVEYTNDENEADWWCPCEEDSIIVRDLYRNTILHGKKENGTKKRNELFFNSLGDLMNDWDYNILV